MTTSNVALYPLSIAVSIIYVYTLRQNTTKKGYFKLALSLSLFQNTNGSPVAKTVSLLRPFHRYYIYLQPI